MEKTWISPLNISLPFVIVQGPFNIVSAVTDSKPGGGLFFPGRKSPPSHLPPLPNQGRI